MSKKKHQDQVHHHVEVYSMSTWILSWQNAWFNQTKMSEWMNYFGGQLVIKRCEKTTCTQIVHSHQDLIRFFLSVYLSLNLVWILKTMMMILTHHHHRFYVSCGHTFIFIGYLFVRIKTNFLSWLLNPFSLMFV